MLSEDTFYGRGRGITLAGAATANLHHIERRVVTVTTTGAGAKLILPKKAGRILGWPYFYIYNAAGSTDSVAIEDGDAASVATLAVGERCLITLEAIVGGAVAFKARIKP